MTGFWIKISRKATIFFESRKVFDVVNAFLLSVSVTKNNTMMHPSTLEMALALNFQKKLKLLLHIQHIPFCL